MRLGAPVSHLCRFYTEEIVDTLTGGELPATGRTDTAPNGYSSSSSSENAKDWESLPPRLVERDPICHLSCF